METRSLPLPDGLAGARVDAGLAKLLGFSRSFAAEVCEAGGVTLNGVVAGKSDRLQGGAWLEVSWQPKEALAIVPIPVPDLTIVHDDESIVVINKPSGVAAHPSVGWTVPTVVGALSAAGYRIATSGASERAGIVHRLDVGTSGLMVVAKSETAYTALKRAFHDREVEKIYHSVVQGHPDPSTGTIDAPIGRHPRSDWKFAVIAGGKDSVTHYETLEAFPSASLVEVHLETGRTHQIRVHLPAIGHPVAGDPQYGSAGRYGLTRQFLHSRRIALEHPITGRPIELESELPEDLAKALELARAV